VNIILKTCDRYSLDNFLRIIKMLLVSEKNFKIYLKHLIIIQIAYPNFSFHFSQCKKGTNER